MYGHSIAYRFVCPYRPYGQALMNRHGHGNENRSYPIYGSLKKTLDGGACAPLKGVTLLQGHRQARQARWHCRTAAKWSSATI